MGLIIAGAFILLLAMMKTLNIFKLLTIRKFRRSWKNLVILMAFFFIGYLGVVYIVYIGKEDILLFLTGVIFFFGAVFVYLVVLAGAGTFKILQETNKGLEKKVILLKNQNEEIKQFSYATSQDLNEPLNTLISSVSMLNEKYENSLDDTAKKIMNFSLKAAERMKELIYSLSEYLKVGRDHQVMNCDLNQLVGEVLVELQGSIEASNAQIDSNNLPLLNVNQLEIKRLFQNLISNAIKYRKEKVSPIIQINAVNEEGHWLFSIIDNGIGIKEKHFEKVFHIFSQLNPRDKFEGIGIGLSICKKVVEIHNGKIWLDSKEGEGTTFYFTLPS
jgi:two-component system, chemotaxis family, sensor kinase Cph1